MVGAAATIVTDTTTSQIATHGAGEGPILGRERGAALLVRDEPGIGESTLLAAVVGTAEDVEMRVLVRVSTTLSAPSSAEMILSDMVAFS